MKVLILCSGNSCRSQMAEGFLRHYLTVSGEKASAEAVKSAGLEPHGIDPRAVQVMREIGINISRQTSNHVSEYIHDSFDYVITVCDNAAANCPVFPGPAVRIHWPFNDPAAATGSQEEIIKVFRTIREQIGGRIRQWLASQP